MKSELESSYCYNCFLGENNPGHNSLWAINIIICLPKSVNCFHSGKVLITGEKSQHYKISPKGKNDILNNQKYVD